MKTKKEDRREGGGGLGWVWSKRIASLHLLAESVCLLGKLLPETLKLLVKRLDERLVRGDDHVLPVLRGGAARPVEAAADEQAPVEHRKLLSGTEGRRWEEVA